MKDFKCFSKHDAEIIQRELAVLYGIRKAEDGLITGYNYYFDYIEPEGLVIAISFLHRFNVLKEDLERDLKSGKYTPPLVSEERKKEIPFERGKRAIYHALPRFVVQKTDENTIYIDLETHEEIPRDIIRKCDYVKDIGRIAPKYKGRHIGIKELDGFEINLNIKSREEAFEVLKLLREKAYDIEIDEKGLPIYDEYGEEIKRDKSKIWTLADEVPCIILGRDMEDFLGRKMPDFSLCEKTYLTKCIGRNVGEEVSFITHNTTQKLKQHKSYQRLKDYFGDMLRPIPVFANNSFIATYIDKVHQI